MQVFHELARHLQTRRLIAGDSMSLDQDKNFYCVVDGMVQVFAQRGHPTEGHSVSWDDEDLNGYQLLNEVGSGGMLSSLFTILSLFTEDVKISWKDDNDPASPVSSVDTLPMPSGRARANSDVSQLELENAQAGSSHQRRASGSSSASTIHGDPMRSFQSDASVLHRHHHGPRVLPMSSLVSPPQKDAAHKPPQIHHGVVARATEDTTLAVIPAEAFSRLTKMFPKATAHIVQGLFWLLS
jgi:lysophospholipid hydrolase